MVALCTVLMADGKCAMFQCYLLAGCMQQAARTRVSCSNHNGDVFAATVSMIHTLHEPLKHVWSCPDGAAVVHKAGDLCCHL